MERHFKNTYPDYTDGGDNHLFSKLDGKIMVSAQYKSIVNESLRNLIPLVSKQILSPTTQNRPDYSVYTGISGLVSFYIRHSQLVNDSLLKEAHEASNKCLEQVGRGSRVTYLCGDAGPLTNAALIYHLMKDDRQKKICVQQLLSMHKKIIPGNDESIDELPDEILYGRAGYLYCLLLLNHYKICSNEIQPLIRPVLEAILNSGKAMVARQKIIGTPLMYEWHGKKYYGAAHGVAGILVLLMQASSYLPAGALHELVKPTVDYMIKTLFPSGNMMSSHMSSSGDKLVHWCHGAPGAVFLFGMAYKCFNDSKYLEIAKKAATVVWQRGLLKKGYGLCHGSSGNAYALLFMYQISKEVQYLHEALQFGHWCCNYGTHGCSVPDRPYSLFEGLTGTAYFLLDSLTPETAAFPGFILPPGI